jgi:site-specific DNA-methyltransferase (adenine-specific)
MRQIVRHQGRARLYAADCRDALKTIPDSSIDSIVTDPPYALVSVSKRFGATDAAPAQFGKDGLYARASAGFMGKAWDTGETAFNVGFWAECLRVLKPGGHIISFGGTRTYHRLACAIEDAGFEIRDQLAWVYGSGFPKSHDVSRAIDKHLGLEPRLVSERATGWNGTLGGKAALGGISTPDVRREYAPASPEALEWDGWGTALKPAWEPIALARKPLIGSVAANVLAHGAGALNIDASRVPIGESDDIHSKNPHTSGGFGHGDFTVYDKAGAGSVYEVPEGRWPANLIHDGSDEVLQFFPNPDTGRFFYCPKASNKDRDEGCEGLELKRTGGRAATADGSMLTGSGNERVTSRRNTHPTVKPTSLMEYFIRMVTPPGGVVLDPFMGSGSTGKAALLAGFKFIGVDSDPEYMPIAEARIAWAAKQVDARKALEDPFDGY